MTDQGATSRRQRSRSMRRRRFLIGSIAALAALAVSMGVSFLGDTGTATLALSTPVSDSFVYSVTTASPATAPSGLGSGLRYGSTVSGSAFTAAQNPNWTPAPSTAGSVTTPGDIAVIDATSTTMPNGGNVLVSIYLTNLSTLAAGYSSYAFPIEIFQCASSCAAQSDTGTGTSGTWTLTSETPLDSNSLPTTFLTNNTGFLTFTLPEGYYYDITMPTGGSFYTLSGVTSSNATPSYYITAQRA